MSRETGRRPAGLREVLLLALLVLGAVLAIEAVATAIPSVRDAFTGSPVTAIVLAIATVAVLALVLLRRPTPPRG